MYSYLNLEDASKQKDMATSLRMMKFIESKIGEFFCIAVSYYPIIYAVMSKYNDLLFFDHSVGLQNVVYQLARLCQHKSLYTV